MICIALRWPDVAIGASAARAFGLPICRSSEISPKACLRAATKELSS